MTEKRSRRLAAVMFTDVVGYTTMMQEDEEVALDARRRHREALERIVSEAGGEVLQLFGDGGLSIFPSSVNAVKAATELQQTFREEPEVPVRIGIHQGDVELDEFGAAGNAVNIASRIESLSPPGGVLISEKVFAEVRNQPNIDTESLGLFHFKNVGEPIQLHAVQGGSLTVPEREQLGGPTGEPIGTRAKTLAFLPLLLIGGVLVLAIAALVSAQSTGAGFGVLSYLGTWAAFAGGLWFLFDKTEEAVSPVVRRSASAWLRNVDPAAAAARWPSLFAAAFDRVFGEKHWSWRCFRRSAVASVLSVGILFGIYWSIYGNVGESFWGLADDEPSPTALMSGLPAILLFAALNVAPDFVSLLQTRWVLRWLQVRPGWALVVLDGVATAVIAAGTFLVFHVGLFGSVSHGSFDPAWSDIFAAIPENLYGLISLDPEMSMFGTTLGIFFYSTFLTSIWLWLYLAAGAAVRVAGGFNVGLRWLRGFTDLDQQPFRSLGFAAVLITTLIFLAGIPLILLN